jgi:uncharacterized membrane protein YphA (DoxX/SURF4 family)
MEKIRLVGQVTDHIRPELYHIPELSLHTVGYDIAYERLRQARLSFDMAQVSSIAVASFSLVGAIMLMMGNVTEGTAIVSVSMVSSVGCMHLAKDANDRLDNLIDALRPQ